MSYAVKLGERMNYMTPDDKVENILYAPYAYDDFDKADITSRLDLMSPDNMYVFFHSKLVEQLKDA